MSGLEPQQQRLLLEEERRLKAEWLVLAHEVQAAGRMIHTAKTAQAKFDSVLYTEQILSELASLEGRIYEIQRKRGVSEDGP